MNSGAVIFYIILVLSIIFIAWMDKGSKPQHKNFKK